MNKKEILGKQWFLSHGYYVKNFFNNDWKYLVLPNSIEHLVRDGYIIATGKEIDSYNNGDYSYKNKFYYLYDKEHNLKIKCKKRLLRTNGEYNFYCED